MSTHRGTGRRPSGEAEAGDRVPQDEEHERPGRAGSGERPATQRLVAELIGTFALTFVAAGADIAGKITGGEVTPVARAVAPGLLVMAFIYAVGDASGAHFNPAVSLGFTLKRLLPATWMVLYWIAQLAGALLAAGVLRVLFGSAIEAGVSTPHIDAGPAVALEIILTWLLVTVILGTADRYRLVGPSAAFAVGGTIALCGLVALPLEGASMNPARSLGPAIVAGRLDDVWIYVLGPAIGAGIAFILTVFLHGESPRDQKQVEAAQGEPDAKQKRRRTTARAGET